MSFDDDEYIVANQEVSDKNSKGISVGGTTISIINKVNVPLEQFAMKVLVELKGRASIDNDRSPVDIVAVLDISGNMKSNGKLEKLKAAMQFVIKKLTSIHRLSVVTFDHKARRLCKLRVMTEKAKIDIENKINNVVISDHEDSRRNISAGLEMALKVLGDRKLKLDHKTIMLISDHSDDPMVGGEIKSDIKELPVYTFAVNTEKEAPVLKNVAKQSKGGTFTAVNVEGGTESSNNMGIAFAQFFASYHTKALCALELQITPNVKGMTIDKVYAGKYKQSQPNANGTVTISIGDLYDQEICKVLVQLNLPEQVEEGLCSVLELSCSYKIPGEKEDGEPLENPPISVDVTRCKRWRGMDFERVEVLIEKLRFLAADVRDEYFKQVKANQRKINS